MVTLVEDGGEEGVWEDADDEDCDDCNHHDGDAVSGGATVGEAGFPEGEEDEGVEEDEDDERDDGADEVLRPGVAGPECLVCPEFGHFHVQAGDVGASIATADSAVSEESIGQ